MAVVKGNFGDGGGPPTLDNIDLTHATTMECEECGCKGFKQTLMLKKLSALVSPSSSALWRASQHWGNNFSRFVWPSDINNVQESINPEYANENAGSS